jgi:hypothetical protein
VLDEAGGAHGQIKQPMQLSRMAPYQPPCTPPIGFIAWKVAAPSNATRPRAASVGAKPSVRPMGGCGRRPAIMSSMKSSPVRVRIASRPGRSAGEVAKVMAWSPVGDPCLGRQSRDSRQPPSRQPPSRRIRRRNLWRGPAAACDAHR